MAKIVAVVTTAKDEVGGGAPIFIQPDPERMKKTAFLLEKLLDAAAHELNETVYLIVDRHPENG
ncbi:hypothetical protein GE107_11365 [Cohnella sp. CFH 77786]|uniref:capping complex subunit for YIEGIA n=1 Tax=Cohnella sp. CFH 77786 TaxID=2662265 RepID=UPI001C60816D|nr:hypothetical protein [Cohnella sp. CFH 77786]MBW5446659.1 hypothetical protein [Cohnella sp. CFH 77786]